ncbi:MAG: RraA family protein [Pirellulales bacterium]
MVKQSWHDITQRLAAYDTPTICNVIELFDVRPRQLGYMDGRIRSCFPDLGPMVGLAVTAAFRSAAPPSGADVYGSMQQQLELMSQAGGPTVIVVQDLDDPPAAAVFGEVMCSTYRAFGAAGLVTSGAGRDLDQVHRLGFPVFTNGTICSHGNCHLLYVGQPVRVGGLVVTMGELLHGDANGVTQIPLDIASEVADMAAEYVEAERIVLDYVQGTGPKTIREFADRQKQLSERLGQLKRQVARSVK